MSSLRRTQIYIDADQMQQLQMAASKERGSVSLLIRIAITQFLSSKAKRLDWDADALTKAIGKIKLPVSDASMQHDHYLYG